MEGNLPCNNFLLTFYFKNIETGETITTSALDNLGWDCPKKTTTTYTTTTAMSSNNSCKRTDLSNPTRVLRGDNNRNLQQWLSNHWSLAVALPRYNVQRCYPNLHSATVPRDIG